MTYKWPEVGMSSVGSFSMLLWKDRMSRQHQGSSAHLFLSEPDFKGQEITLSS